MDELEYLSNKVRRIEASLTLQTIHTTEYRTLVTTVLSSPGLYTAGQIARAFDRLVSKQKRESIKAYDVMMTQAPLPEDEDIRLKLEEMGFMNIGPDAGDFDIEKMDIQREFPFPELDDIREDSDLDLFGDEDSIPF